MNPRRHALHVPLAVRGRGPGDHAPAALTLLGVLFVAACFFAPALLLG